MPEGPSILIVRESLLPFIGKKINAVFGNTKNDKTRLVNQKIQEVLFRIKVHPKSRVGALPAKIRQNMIRESRNYSLDFLKWKKEFTLKKHWLISTKKNYPRVHSLVKKEWIGNTNRRTFFCETCQILYD